MYPFTTLIKLIIYINLYIKYHITQKCGNNTVYYFRTRIFFSILYFTIPTYCETKTVKTVNAINETIPFIWISEHPPAKANSTITIFTTIFFPYAFSSLSSSLFIFCTGEIHKMSTLLTMMIPHAFRNEKANKSLKTNIEVCTITEHMKHFQKLFKCTPPAKLRSNIKKTVSAINSGIICKYTAMPEQTAKQVNISSPIWKPYWYTAYDSFEIAPESITNCVNFSDNCFIIYPFSFFSVLSAFWADEKYNSKRYQRILYPVSMKYLPKFLLPVSLHFEHS